MGTLERRIQGRGRDAETGVTLDYLGSLNQLHRDWFREVYADGHHHLHELNADLDANTVFKRVCQLNIFDSNVVQPCYGPEEDERVPSPLVRLISVRIAYPGQSDRPMAKVVVPTDMTVAQFVGRVQALLQDYAGELLASPAVTPHWQMRLASDTATPLLYPPTPAGTPAHLSSWEQHLPISATGIEHHSDRLRAPPSVQTQQRIGI